MKEYELKYGCNPNQKPARIYMEDGSDLPIRVLNGRPGYINLLDALNSWQLVRELDGAAGMAAAASFKHVSPTSAALGLPLPQRLKRACFVEDAAALDASPLACAYARARGADRLCSFGDWAALSRVCDVATAELLKREVSDGVIAPGYEPQALDILKSKRNGSYAIVEMDPAYVPTATETRQVFGVSFSQGRNDCRIDRSLLTNVVTENKLIPDFAARDLTVAMITLKYTQSNSVCFAYDGQAIGVGAGQQSRVHCTRLAASKADDWFLRRCDKVLSLPFRADMTRPERDNAVASYIHTDQEDICAEGVWQRRFTRRPEPFTQEERRACLDAVSGVSLASDAFFPFGDNIERARESGVSYVAQPGGSVRDGEVIACCDKYGIAMAFTGLRLFHH